MSVVWEEEVGLKSVCLGVCLGDAMMRSSLEECMFADDIILHMRVCSNLGMISLQSDVTMVADWVESADLHLNKSKTKCMLRVNVWLKTVCPL